MEYLVLADDIYSIRGAVHASSRQCEAKCAGHQAVDFLRNEQHAGDFVFGIWIGTAGCDTNSLPERR
jgi:hypothetical protein